MSLPPAPAHEDASDACCAECGGLFHRTEEHGPTPGRTALAALSASMAGGFPPGYDPAEADRLIGRDVPDAQ